MFFSLSNVNNNDNDSNANNENHNNNNNNNININDNGPNGYRLLSAQGVETLQTFLREHGNECIRQFVKVRGANVHVCFVSKVSGVLYILILRCDIPDLGFWCYPLVFVHISRSYGGGNFSFGII